MKKEKNVNLIIVKNSPNLLSNDINIIIIEIITHQNSIIMKEIKSLIKHLLANFMNKIIIISIIKKITILNNAICQKGLETKKSMKKVPILRNKIFIINNALNNNNAVSRNKILKTMKKSNISSYSQSQENNNIRKLTI